MFDVWQNGMNALDWAEEGEHVEIAELLSHAMNPTVTPVTPLPHEVPASPETETETEQEKETAHEDSAFADANPINEVKNCFLCSRHLHFFYRLLDKFC